MEHDGAASRDLAAAVDATIADLHTLRDEEIPVPDDVQVRIRQTIETMNRR